MAVGGWVKTWFEHMLDIERRRFALMGKSPGEVNDRMKSAATLYYEWLIKNKSVDGILREHPELWSFGPKAKIMRICMDDHWRFISSYRN